MLYHFRILTNSTILLCVWHVRRAWLKNIGNKVKGRENIICIFRALGHIMHSCQDDASVQNAVARIFEDFSEETNLLKYFKTTWLANNKICKFFLARFMIVFYNIFMIIIFKLISMFVLQSRYVGKSLQKFSSL